MNNMRSILYSLNEGLNESNSNNPANLQVGETIIVNHYNGNEIDDTYSGIIELITNSEVIIRDVHTNKSYNFIFKGFNAHQNGIEFEDSEDSSWKFYIFD